MILYDILYIEKKKEGYKMLTLEERKRYQKVQHEILGACLDNAEDDKEYFQNLCWALQEITNCISRFTDMWDEVEEEEEERENDED